jgi:hypothetical protein
MRKMGRTLYVDMVGSKSDRIVDLTLRPGVNARNLIISQI